MSNVIALQGRGKRPAPDEADPGPARNPHAMREVRDGLVEMSCCLMDLKVRLKQVQQLMLDEMQRRAQTEAGAAETPMPAGGESCEE